MRSERNPIRTTQAGVRTFENNSGSDCPEFGVLKVDDVVFTPTDNANYWNIRQIFDGNTPTDDCIFGIAQTPIKDTKSGPVMLSGVTPCKIQVSDENHTHAIAGTSVDKLESAGAGPAEILWKESGTGEKDAVVRLGNSAGVASYLSDMFLDNFTNYNSTNSGWNLIPVIFRDVTNPLGTDPDGPDYSWSTVFDSRPSTYPTDRTAAGLKCKKAGTYFGVFNCFFILTKGVVNDIEVGEVQSATTISGVDVWQIPSSSPKTFEIHEYDGVKFEIDLLITAEGNTTHDSNYASVGEARCQIAPQLAFNKLSPGTINTENIYLEIPFYFSVKNDDVPFELQPWINIDTSNAAHWAIGSTSASLRPNYIHAKHTSWIKYLPDLTQFDSEIYVATP